MAGLSLSGMAARLGRTGCGARSLVSRLEKGRAENPSLGLVADYLRACGTGFEAIADLLIQYTSRPLSVPSVQADDEPAAADRETPEPARPRHVRSTAQRAEHWRRRYEHSRESGKPMPANVRPELVEHVRASMERLAVEKATDPPLVPEDAHPGRLASCQPADERFPIARGVTQAARDRLLRVRLATFAADILTCLKGLRHRVVAGFYHVLLPQLMRVCDETRNDPTERDRRIGEAVAPSSCFCGASRSGRTTSRGSRSSTRHAAGRGHDPASKPRAACLSG